MKTHETDDATFIKFVRRAFALVTSLPQEEIQVTLGINAHTCLWYKDEMIAEGHVCYSRHDIVYCAESGADDCVVFIAAVRAAKVPAHVKPFTTHTVCGVSSEYPEVVRSTI